MINFYDEELNAIRDYGICFNQTTRTLKDSYDSEQEYSIALESMGITRY